MPTAHLGRPASGILGQVQPGPDDAITDIDGVLVGHCTREEPGWLTGVTVVVAPPGTVGGVDVRGGGPGTRETDLLDPRTLVDAVDAVVLAGGSAFGLAAADGVSTGLYAAGRGWPVGPGSHERVPIVPAAILFDLGRGETEAERRSENGVQAIHHRFHPRGPVRPVGTREAASQLGAVGRQGEGLDPGAPEIDADQRIHAMRHHRRGFGIAQRLEQCRAAAQVGE